jgi:hypothetical protein
MDDRELDWRGVNDGLVDVSHFPASCDLVLYWERADDRLI